MSRLAFHATGMTEPQAVHCLPNAYCILKPRSVFTRCAAVFLACTFPLLLTLSLAEQKTLSSPASNSTLNASADFQPAFSTRAPDFGSEKIAAGNPATLGEHYLMLVAGNRASSLTSSQLTLFNQSEYDGLAVRFLTQYDTTPVPSAQEMASKLLEFRKLSGKDFWPWVSFNRMVGRDPDVDNPYGRDPYFSRTHGIDLENSAGTQADFLQIWRRSLRAANQSHAPGIIVDLELYVNYKAYEPALLAKQIGKPVDQTLDLLHKLGIRMADAAAQEYSDAIMWFLLTDLCQYGWKVDGNVKYYPTPAYIVMGLLDEIRDKHYALKIISGGEVGLSYCSYSVEHLKQKIKVRADDFAPRLQNYQGALDLGGTMTLWPDRASKTDFMAVGVCAKSDASTVEDQQAYLELLFRTYRYNWVYGTNNSGYDPFNASTAPRFNTVIKKAKAKVLRSP